jgi:single-strand DNA-binding protein
MESKSGLMVKHQIVCEGVEFGESKATAAQNASATARPAPGQKPDENGFMQIPNGIDEELPFN